MEFQELQITINPFNEDIKDILMAELSQLGFDSFSESDNKLSAYSENEINRFEIEQTINNLSSDSIKFQFSFQKIKKENWNTEWEKNFNPIIIGNECLIRAPFHKEVPITKYEIIIEPKMSFGTGHHETTSLMVEEILKLNLENRNVLDMGCGTGILAILASMRGAKNITAIDNDEWAYLNTVENIERNGIKNITAIQGDVNNINGLSFDVILANINKNILLEDIKFYVQSLSKNGSLLVSGFYENDADAICSEASKHGLSKQNFHVNNNWTSICLQKN